MIQQNRRAFLKQAAMAAAAGALSGTLPTDFNGLAEGADQLTWAKAPCRFCGTGWLASRMAGWWRYKAIWKTRSIVVCCVRKVIMLGALSMARID